MPYFSLVDQASAISIRRFNFALVVRLSDHEAADLVRAGDMCSTVRLRVEALDFHYPDPRKITRHEVSS